MSMTPEQLQQLEALCERLYNSAEPNERTHAEMVRPRVLPCKGNLSSQIRGRDLWSYRWRAAADSSVKTSVTHRMWPIRLDNARVGLRRSLGETTTGQHAHCLEG